MMVWSACRVRASEKPKRVNTVQRRLVKLCIPLVLIEKETRFIKIPPCFSLMYDANELRALVISVIPHQSQTAHAHYLTIQPEPLSPCSNFLKRIQASYKDLVLLRLRYGDEYFTKVRI